MQLRALKNQIAQLGADQMTTASADRLLGGRPLPKVSSAISLRRAQTLTQNFMRFYHYALPFDRRVLQAAWNSCTAKNCAEARRRAEETVGRLARADGDDSGKSTPVAQPPRRRVRADKPL